MSNEGADQLANIAIIEEGWAMDLADIINAEREVGWTKGFTDYCDTASLSRMKELVV